MTVRVGVHIVGRTLRAATLDEAGAVRSTSVRELQAAVLPAVANGSVSDSTIDAIARFLPEGVDVHLALPGGYFHTRKVPLEVADEPARCGQIEWEIGQSLASPGTQFAIHYVPVRSSALWFAVRHDVIDLLRALFSRAGRRLAGTCPEPLALFHACRSAGVVGPQRCAAVLLGCPYSSIVVFEADGISAAEAIADASDSDVAATGSPAAQAVVEGTTLARWVAGARSGRSPHERYERIYVCGAFGADGTERPVERLVPPLESLVLTPHQKAGSAAYAAAAGAALSVQAGSLP